MWMDIDRPQMQWDHCILFVMQLNVSTQILKRVFFVCQHETERCEFEYLNQM